MSPEENERRRSDPRVVELKEAIWDRDRVNEANRKARLDSGTSPYTQRSAGYVFVSYKSDDWATVLPKIVHTLVFDHGLNVYYDGSFDRHNDGWFKQMPKNMDAPACKGVLAFLSAEYTTSYATLMELLHSQKTVLGRKGYLPIIPIYLEDKLYDLSNSIVADEDTGLGISRYADFTSNPNAKEELALFLKDYDDVAERFLELRKMRPEVPVGPDDSEPILRKGPCNILVSEMLRLQKHSNNVYSNSKAFYDDLVATIKYTCGPEVFSTNALPRSEHLSVPVEHAAKQESKEVPVATESEGVSATANADESKQSQPAVEKRKRAGGRSVPHDEYWTAFDEYCERQPVFKDDQMRLGTISKRPYDLSWRHVNPQRDRRYTFELKRLRRLGRVAVQVQVYERNEDFFDLLAEHVDAMAKETGLDLEARKAQKVYIIETGLDAKVDDPADFDRQFEWIVDSMTKLDAAIERVTA